MSILPLHVATGSAVAPTKDRNMKQTDSAADPHVSKRVIIDITLTGDDTIVDFILAVAQVARNAGQDRIQYCLMLNDVEGH